MPAQKKKNFKIRNMTFQVGGGASSHTTVLPHSLEYSENPVSDLHQDALYTEWTTNQQYDYSFGLKRL